MEFETIIGLEIHVEMKTKSKMFSSSPVVFGDEPNTHVSSFDIAFPGTLPLVNKQAVINSIRVCHALHMNIDHEIWFDRKNYFYSDLPKGYQITQENRPLGKNGYLKIGEKTIGIESLHMEEDTCKQFHYNDHSLLDYNRSGVPLIEIVSKPDMKSGEEAMRFVEKIKSIVTFLEVSNGKMENGSLRCDVNISVHNSGSKELGTKVEIKNLNSLANIQKAIDYETNRQIDLLSKGQKIKQETRRFDEKKKETILMREKVEGVDYRYMTENNIAPIRLSDEFIKSSIESSPELAEVRLEKYKQLGLNEYDSSQLVANKDISDYFEKTISLGADPKLTANWILVDVQSILNKNEIEITDFIIEANRLASLIIMIEERKVSNKQAREIFARMLLTKESPERISESLNMVVIDDSNQILKVIKVVLEENPQTIIDYKNGKDKATSFIVGQVMKKMQGQADPALTNKLVIEELGRR